MQRPEVSPRSNAPNQQRIFTNVELTLFAVRSLFATEQSAESRKALLNERHGGPLEVLKKVQSEANVSNARIISVSSNTLVHFRRASWVMKEICTAEIPCK